ncbi:MAG: hypothetical protein ABEJ80_04215 [Halarchaeum sp.]
MARLRRWLLVAGALCVAAALVTGTGAVSRASLDRDVSVNVAPDASAYLGVDASAAGERGNATATVAVTNRYPGGVTLGRVVVRTNGSTRTRRDVGSGETARVRLENATCGAPVWVNATGAGVAVAARRSVEC